MSKLAIIHQTIDELPFSDALTWERFQTFCTDVLSQRSDIRECREYLAQGNKQDGIDTYAITYNNNKVVAQCKFVKSLAPSDINRLIEEFIDEEITSDTSEFILCTSFDLKKLRDEKISIKNARARLKSKKINLTVWDKRGLSLHLRNNPLPIVINRYFGPEIAKAFYGEIWDNYIHSLQIPLKKAYTYNNDYIERSVISYIEYYSKKESYSWRFAENPDSQSLISVFSNNEKTRGKWVVLLSIAGYGKSEELNRIAAYYSTNDRTFFPVRQYLRDYEGYSIEDMLSKAVEDWKNIAKGDMLLLFDGLDEIKESLYQTFINNLNSFLENNQAANVLVTSRFNFYDLKAPPLREFNVYILEALSSRNIKKYISSKLNSEETAFKKIIEENNFSEYINNPYYLKRLVQFFKSEEKTFPKNKSSLFERVIFDQFDKDSARFNFAKDVKDKLFTLAKKIAFCMTITAKSSLSENDIDIIIPDSDSRRQLKLFRIININQSEEGLWSFEHKNIQEYLCASFLSKFNFDQIKEMITFSFNKERIIPRFINTVSLLFEIMDNKDVLFLDISKWIQNSQPELLIRFERDQLSKEVRRNIFKAIFNYYESRKLSLRVSSNLSILELANFVEIDGSIISFISEKIGGNISDDTANDALLLLACCKKHFLFKEQLNSIFFSVLNNEKYPNYVKGSAILSLGSFNSHKKEIFEQILKTKINIEEYEIRKRLLNFLCSSKSIEEYFEFILHSATIFEKDNTHTVYFNAYDPIIRALLSLTTGYNIKKIIEFIRLNPHLIHSNSHNKRQVHITKDDLKIILSKAITIYSSDRSILKTVYRLFWKSEKLHYEEKILNLFKEFFSETCGLDVIFNKIYKKDKKNRLLVEFVNEGNIYFLVNEYENKRLPEDDAVFFRNRLSWKNQNLTTLFMEKINNISPERPLFYEKTKIDFDRLYIEYKTRNQTFLLDRNEFIKEAVEIFKAINKLYVDYDDMHDDENEELKRFSNSLVKEAIIDFCIKRKEAVKQEDFLETMDNKEYWESFVVDEVHDYLLNKKDVELMPELFEFTKRWLINKIESLDFSNAIKDLADGVFTYIEIVEFIKGLYLLMDFEIEDRLLFNMLLSDISGCENTGEKDSIAGKILRKIEDRELLKGIILENIRSGKLASPVLSTHFWMCYKLSISECLGDLYAAIINENLFKDYEKRKLADYYLGLGGEIEDFHPFLIVPKFNREEDYLISWTWYLIEKFASTNSSEVIDILVQIASDDNQGKQNKIAAITYLLQMGKYEGIEFWSLFIRQNHILPSGHDNKVLLKFTEINNVDDIFIPFISTLDYSFEKRLFSKSSFDSIQEAIYPCLIAIAARNISTYHCIRVQILMMLEKYSNEDFSQKINMFLERFDNIFYEKNEYTINIKEALNCYIGLTG